MLGPRDPRPWNRRFPAGRSFSSTSSARSGGCFSGESFLGLLLSFHLEGLLLWIPFGGVDEMGSGTESGSSGSGGGGILTPVLGERLNVRPRKGFKSSVPSGAGGGNGLGTGFAGERRGAAVKLPLALLTEPADLAGSELRGRSSSASGSGSLVAAPAAGVSACAVKRSVRLCSLPASLPRRREVSREGDDFAGDCDRLLSRIWGLCRERLALVGEAKEGLCDRAAEVAVLSPPVGVDAVGIVSEYRGEVRRRLGVDSSIIISEGRESQKIASCHRMADPVIIQVFRR